MIHCSLFSHAASKSDIDTAVKLWFTCINPTKERDMIWTKNGVRYKLEANGVLYMDYGSRDIPSRFYGYYSLCGWNAIKIIRGY